MEKDAEKIWNESSWTKQARDINLNFIRENNNEYKISLI